MLPIPSVDVPAWATVAVLNSSVTRYIQNACEHFLLRTLSIILPLFSACSAVFPVVCLPAKFFTQQRVSGYIFPGISKQRALEPARHRFGPLCIAAFPALGSECVIWSLAIGCNNAI
jgi:hypothetical protein